MLIWLLIYWKDWNTQNAYLRVKSLHSGNLPMPKWPIFFTYDNWHSVQAKAWLISNNTMICISQLPDWTLFVWYVFQINILTSFRIVLQNTPKLQIYIIADKHISSNIDNIHHRPWYISRKYFSVNISYLPRGCRLGTFLRWWPHSTMWAGPLIYLWPPPGCLNNPRGGYSAWKLMGVCRWPLKIGPKKIEEKIEFGAKKIDFCKNW